VTQFVPIQQYGIYLDKWDIWLTVVATPEGIFYVLRELCEALGIKDVQQQAEQLQARRASAAFIRKWPVQSKAKSRQLTWCLHHDVLGGWMFMVNERTIRVEFRDRLVEFQRDAFYALNRVLFGEVEGTSAIAVDPAQPGTITKLSDWLGRPREQIQLSEPESTNNSD
jgi:hypothetical protein